MEFKLTEDTLQRLEQKEEITVRDIMGFVVTDICRDLQNGCGELTRPQLPFFICKCKYQNKQKCGK